MYGRVVENQPTIWIIGNWLIFPALLSATTLGPMHFILTTHYSLTNQYATLHYTTLHCTARTTNSCQKCSKDIGIREKDLGFRSHGRCWRLWLGWTDEGSKKGCGCAWIWWGFLGYWLKIELNWIELNWIQQATSNRHDRFLHTYRTVHVMNWLVIGMQCKITKQIQDV